MQWDGAANVSHYSRAGTVPAHSLVEDDFGIFLHGPLFRPQQQQPHDFAPPLYFTGSLVDKIWRLENIVTADASASASVAADMKFVAWSASPSTLWPVPPAAAGLPERFLVAEGNPFVVNPGNHTEETWFGGVELIDEGKCSVIFPSGFDRMIGKVVNTVECHPSGFCFFSVWKFYDDSLPANDDCLYWCRVNSVNDPTTCVEYGIMKDETGTPICHKDGRGAVHGLRIGKTDPKDVRTFDLLLLFTGKGTFDSGDSSIYKLKVRVDRAPSRGNAVTTLSRDPWGVELTQRSVPKPHDVGVDHAWIDADGKYVWVGTFRQENNGVHMLEYDTGKLVHSIQGISDIIPGGKYVYTSGLDGVGAWGKPGSVIALTTCEKFGQQFAGGKSAVVLIDISGAAGSNGTLAKTVFV
jgi:hypothetical protein